MPFTFENASIPDVKIITAAVYKDDRGYFLENYKKSDFNFIGKEFVQDNHSFSKKGVIRGLHFQNKPYEQGKLVSVISGKIFDVAVDIRKDSTYYKKYVAIELSENNHKMLYIPEGFAHGFQALENSHVLYKTTSEYNKASESGIIFKDKTINIEWPLSSYTISEKDSKLKILEEALK
jgi:dTDP-4-dehydrorhamnose 3,5-epimerase